jgi:hypothetical protein
MHRKSTEADGADGADGDNSEYKSVRGGQSGQNSFELDGTRLGLLLLHVGSNSDEFGGQAFMEHYTVLETVPDLLENILFVTQG